MLARVTITALGVYQGRTGVLVATPTKHQQYHCVRLDGDDRDRGFKPTEYTKTQELTR